uniref:Scarecrow-like protein 28 n=1 Tax=Kalanchoe fedtschenkoi TaxID=63787 RepID=A0A7N0US01_KALFE
MLAGCSSSTLLSPRHRLRIEASKQFQACHFPLTNSMSTQRLDMQCSFPRREAAISQPIRPVGISVDQKPIESRAGSCSLKQQNIHLPPLATRPRLSLRGRRETEGGIWAEGNNLKRFAERSPVDRSKKVKRKRGSSSKDVEQSEGAVEGDDDDDDDDASGLRLGQLDGRSFWFQSGFEVSSYLPGLSQPEAPFSLTVSQDEDRVCFVPSEVISPPPLPLTNNPWIDFGVSKITHLGDKNVETSHRQPAVREPSESRTSYESSLSLRLNENPPPVHDSGNGSGNPHPLEGTPAQVVDESDEEEQLGFELVGDLIDCVEAIGSKNILAINHFIAKLGDLASPRGRTPIVRLVAYFTEGLAIRTSRIWPNLFHLATPRDLDLADDEHGTSFRLLNQISPIPKFIHFSSNEILLRAFEGKQKVHIIDFDIKQGLQWPSFFQSLASRSRPPIHVRITGVGESKHELNETGDRLAGFAGAMNLPFEFHPVVDRLEDVRLWMLHVKEGESVAVNCMFQLHKTLYDSSGGALRDLLGLIRSTNPTVVVMAEQEASTNFQSLDTRVCNSLKYYSAIFDSLHCSLPSPSAPARIKTEEMFGREIRNIIACEGSERYERHETFTKWKKLMSDGGFTSMRISEREILQIQMLLKMYSFHRFSVKTQSDEEEEGAPATALTLSWEDEPLYTVSAWTPTDAPGASSSFSQRG